MDNERDELGRFKKGIHPITQFKKGVRHSPNTEFKKGCTPWIKGRKGISHPKSEWKKGQFSGKNHPRWKGGKFKRKDGYIEVLCPEHPRTKNKTRKYLMEHIIVAEKKIGRYLIKGEQVHHINGNRDDNSPENLIVITSSEHSRIHAKKQNNRIGRYKSEKYDKFFD